MTPSVFSQTLFELQFDTDPSPAPQLGELLHHLSRYDELTSVTLSSHGSGIDPDLVEGMLPEIYDPINTALRPLIADKAAAAILVRVAEGAIFVPSDLVTIAQSDLSGSSGDRFLAAFIEYADQCGLLARLLKVAASLAPADTRIARVRTLVDRMEAVFHGPATEKTNRTSQAASRSRG